MEEIKISEELICKLYKDFSKGPIMDNGKRYLTEAKFPEKIDGVLSVSVFPKESEPAHFRIDYQGKNARFSLKTGEPIDKLPNNIKKYKNNIKKMV